MYILFYLWFTLYSLLNLYILWPEYGPVQGPKHVVSLNKDNNVR